MNYTLHQLKVLIKVAEKQSITKAADELFLTQPAVSIQLKKLQDQFSVPLTEVVGRQLYVTQFGEEIVNAAKRILQEVDSINYATLAFQKKLAGKLKIAVVSTGKYVMPYYLNRFMQEHPGIDLEMDVTNKASVVSSVEHNEVDFALVSVVPEQLKLNTETLIKNKLYLLASPELGLTKNSKKVFEKYPIVFREEGSATRAAMEKFLETKNFSPKKRLQLTSNEATKQAVISGLGISIMPLIGIKNELKSGELNIIPQAGLPITTEWKIIWLSEKRLSPISEAFLAHIREFKDEIKTRTFSWYEEY